jgi:hypothetical protein
MANSTTQQPTSTMSRTHAIGRLIRRTFKRPGRTFLPLILAPALAVGSLVLSPATAHAAIPQVTTPLPLGKISPSTKVAFGSTIVWDTKRSSDGGSTWNADALLANHPSWYFIGGGNMATLAPTGTGSTNVIVYTPATGAVQTHAAASNLNNVNATFAVYDTSIYNFITDTTTPLTVPTGIAVSSWTQELSSSDAVLWEGYNDDGDVFAVTPTPSSAPSSWVRLTGFQTYVLTATDFLYVLADTSSVSLCKRALAAFASPPTCVVVASGDFTAAWVTLNSLGALTLVRIQDAAVDSVYIASPTLSAVVPLALPTGTQFGGALDGGSPYVVVQDSDTVPLVKTVAADGSLTPAFTIPATSISSPYMLAAAPDRVVGGDPRDGSPSVPVWSRTVSASGFGTESVLPVRAS